MATSKLDRRRFLTLSTVATGAVLAGTGFSAAAPTVLGASQNWSDPATWGGRVPGPNEWVSISQPIVLDSNVSVKGLAIQPGGSLIFDPSRSVTLTSTANIVVLGLLQMRPASANVIHTVKFIGINEANFVGGGMSVLETDVGIWCLNKGVLDLAGTPRLPWVRSTGTIAKGASTITLQNDPVGWRVGDELAIAPTEDATEWQQHDHYDYATVTSVSGRTIGLSRTTSYVHPVAEVGNGITIAPEVLNLTRNVRLEGAANGRAHIFVMASTPQSMSYFAARWMAPRQPDGDGFTSGVLGRYALHFHMGYDGTRGSQIVGAVVRDAGGHAFVAHASHGIKFTSCISHNTFDDAYWWDGMIDNRTPGPETHDTIYLTCVASRVQSDPAFRGYRLNGFSLGAGTGNTALDCVAVGVQGNGEAAGFHWPEMPDSGVWKFQRCVAHNNKCNGIFTWQNTGKDHVVEDFIGYCNGIAGIMHGAYLTSYVYRNCYLYGNGECALDLHSNSYAHAPQRFLGLYCDGVGRVDHAVRVSKHSIWPSRPSEFVSCTFKGQKSGALGLTRTWQDSTPELFDVVNCSTTSTMVWMETPLPGSIVRVQSASGAVAVTPQGTPGTYVPEWNGVVNRIATFTPFTAATPSTFIPIATAASMSAGTAPPRTPPPASTALVNPHGLRPATRLILTGG